MDPRSPSAPGMTGSGSQIALRASEMTERMQAPGMRRKNASRMTEVVDRLYRLRGFYFFFCEL